MFKKGDKIVYPMHGAGIIEGMEEKEILGEKRQYYILRMPMGDMKVMVPVKNMDEIGIREIATEEEMNQVLGVLSDDKTKMPQNWNRRYRENMDKIRSGDIFELADVIRNLILRDREKGLSTGERKMLSSAKQMLISEMVLVREIDEKEAEKVIEENIG